MAELAVLIFQKAGLSKCVSSITQEIEEEIEGSYTRIDEDEEEQSSYPSYGGVVYHNDAAVEEGRFCYRSVKELGESEKSLLLRFLDDSADVAMSSGTL